MPFVPPVVSGAQLGSQNVTCPYAEYTYRSTTCPLVFTRARHVRVRVAGVVNAGGGGKRPGNVRVAEDRRLPAKR